MAACADCKHYEWDDEDSDGHIVGSWNWCGARNGVSNLKQFPFRKTDCPTFKPKEKQINRN